MDMTEHTQRKNTSRDRWALQGRQMALEGWGTEFVRQDHLHNPRGPVSDS